MEPKPDQPEPASGEGAVAPECPAPLAEVVETTEPAPTAAEPAEQAITVQVRAGDLVIEGVLSGIHRYVLRAVPATGEAARRLRARSFRAALINELLALRVAERLGLTRLISTGERFLLAGPAEPGWPETLSSLQRDIDIWLFQHMQPAGELQCRLAGATCSEDRLPWRALQDGLHHGRLQPLEGALRAGLRWNGRAFAVPAGPQAGRCCGCDAVTPVRLFGDDTLCDGCARDSELGERLPSLEQAWLASEGEPDLSVPGRGLKLSANGGLTEPSRPAGSGSGSVQEEFRLDAGNWALLRRMPVQDGRPLAFEELAGEANLLGYVRAGVDNLAAAFDALDGDPQQVVSLGRQLSGFFGDHLRQLLEKEFPLVYPVYENGGNDVVLIGPWQETLDLVVRLRRDFFQVAGGTLPLSAGLALAPPVVPIASAAEQAAEELAGARAAGGNRLAALGSVLEWEKSASLLHRGKTLAGWLKSRAISMVWLKRLAALHAAGRNGGDRWRPALEAAIRDSHVKPGQARAWAVRLSHASPDSDWPWMEFLARYASVSQAPSPKSQVADSPPDEE